MAASMPTVTRCAPTWVLMPAAACAAAATSTALLASMVPLAARPQLLQPCLLVAAATSAHAPAPVQVSEPVAVQAQAWALAAVVQAWALVVEVQQWEDVQVEVADKTNFSLYIREDASQHKK